MLRLFALATMLSLAGCQQPSEVQTDNGADLQKAQAQIERLEKENAELKAQQPKATPEAKKAKAELTDDMDQDYDSEAAASPSKRNLCWQDYCPCDKPETSLDLTICRNAKGGVEMSDEQWAIGAQARDSKREGDRLSREMDGIISDMNAKRY